MPPRKKGAPLRSDNPYVRNRDFEPPSFAERPELAQRLRKWSAETAELQRLLAHVHDELVKAGNQLAIPEKPNLDLIERILKGSPQRHLQEIAAGLGIRGYGTTPKAKLISAVAARINSNWHAKYHVAPKLQALTVELQAMSPAERRALAKAEGVRMARSVDELAKRIMKIRAGQASAQPTSRNADGQASEAAPRSSESEDVCTPANVDPEKWRKYGPTAHAMAHASMKLCSRPSREKCDDFDAWAAEEQATAGDVLRDLGWSASDIGRYETECRRLREDDAPGGGAPATIEEFARTVQEAADGIKGYPGRWAKNGRKVFIASVWDALQSRYSRLERERFDELLVEANRRDLLALHRADLVSQMPEDMVYRSEVNYGNASFHFIESPKRDPAPF